MFRKTMISLFPSIAIFLSGCAGVLPDVNSLNRPRGPEPLTESDMKADDQLQQQVAKIATEAKGKIGFYAVLLESDRSVSLNGNERFAMQSVYKLPIAMAMMKQVEDGRISLDQLIKLQTRDFVNKGQHSPIRDKNPNGAELTVRELIRFAISESDGTASDVLMNQSGGAKSIQAFIDELGIIEMVVKNTEKELGKDWQVQYDNWSSPEAAVALLTSLWEQSNTNASVNERAKSGLSSENAKLLLQFMTDSTPGANRLKGLLPAGTLVAHKTGSSGTSDGLTAATNDIGIITLPNGNHIVIAVFVGDSTADQKTCEAVIAKIAKAVWDKWNKEKLAVPAS